MRLAIPLALVLAATASRDGCGDGTLPPYDPCAGKACGEGCTACAPDDRDCAETAVVKACDPLGRCVAQVEGLCSPPPSWGCVGKRCGDSCGACPEGTDPARCPVPTFAPTACDARLQCVTEGTFTCPP